MGLNDAQVWGREKEMMTWRVEDLSPLNLIANHMTPRIYTILNFVYLFIYW